MKHLRILAAALALFACDDGDGGGGAGGAGGGAGGAGGAGGTQDGGPADQGTDEGFGGEGGLSISGLSAPVDVRLDAHGILNLACATDEDCLAAQGYFHAANRFIQMDIRRRFVRGTLGQIVGSVVLDTDKENRRFFATRTGEPLADQVWAATRPEVKAQFEAYARGVNAWLADLRAGRNGAKLNEEYDFPLIDKTVLTDWEPLDSAACILALVQDLTDDSGTEMTRGRIFGALEPAVAQDLYGLIPGSLAVIRPDDRSKQGRGAPPADFRPRLHAVEQLLAQGARGRPMREPGEVGSNNWVVGPSRSADGKALLANDPHLSLTNPSIWYLVNIDAKSSGSGTLHVAGASFAGLPGVVLGHNEDVAWGATTTYFDMADVYVETLSPDGTGVMFNGQAVPFVERHHTFELSDMPTAEDTFLYVPHHGPVVAIDRDAGTAVTVRWTGHELSTDLMFPLLMNRATSVANARQVVLDTVTSVGQNWVAVDRQGDFAWFPYNHIPNRPWASAELPSWLPLPGDGTAEWQGYLDWAQIPQADHPAEGYVATANGDMTGAVLDGDPTNDGRPMLQHFVADGFRQERIQQRIEAQADHTLATMQTIQADVRSLMGEHTVPALLAAVEGTEMTPGAQQVLATLAAWDFECPTGLEGLDPMGDFGTDEVEAAATAGCTAFHVVWPRLVKRVFDDDKFEAIYPRHAALVRLLTRPETLLAERDYWDDSRTADVGETPSIQIAAAADDAAQWLAANLGPTPDAWRWGRIHSLTLRADLFSAAGVDLFDHGAFANDGGYETVDVAAPRNMWADDYRQAHGPSMRFACHAGDTIQCTIELPGGQPHFRDSPLYNALLPLWLTNQPTPFPFEAAEVEAAAVDTLRIKRAR